MPRQATGTIESYEWADGRTVSWRVRFRAYGSRHRLDLGTNHEGWSEARAQVELDRILAQVERGTWAAPSSPPAGPDTDETIHVTASRWWQRKRRELRPNTQGDYRWRLDHVLRELAQEPTAAISVQRIDEFRDALLDADLGPRSANMILDLLAQVLDDAVEYGLLDQNPARGRRRRLRVPRPARAFLEPDMVVDMLDVAGEWEAELPEHQRYGRRSLLALLCLAGPRISEAIAADRGDFDLAAGRWRIPEAKTPAGARDVELSVFVAEELRDHAARRGLGARNPMWPTSTGGRLNSSNVRNRLLLGIPARGRRSAVRGVIERANERREQREAQLLPARVSPHGLRRSFASLALLAGRDPRWVMAQLGHTDARLTLNVYAQVIQRRSVDAGVVWRLMHFADEGEQAIPGGGVNSPAIGPSSSFGPSGAAGTMRRE